MAANKTPHQEDLCRAIQPLVPHLNHYAWGAEILPGFLGVEETAGTLSSEAWLTSTQKDGLTRLRDHKLTLGEFIERSPEVLGEWSRRLFGDELPVFTKFLSTRFPANVHVGFEPRALEAFDTGDFRSDFLGWLEREQDLLRRYRGFLDPATLASEAAYGRYRRIYETWAIAESSVAWGEPSLDATLIEGLAPYLDKLASSAELAGVIADLRENRRRVVSVLNEVDLAKESGKLLLTRAGIAHAIFGLSHQGHARDHAGERLCQLYENLRSEASGGTSEAALRDLADAAAPELATLRDENVAPPKNEGWLPIVVGGETLIVEPQQTSNTTYSWLDMYTPLVFERGQLVFRKGDDHTGLERSDLEASTAELDFEPTSIDDILLQPEELKVSDSAKGARLFRLVDDPGAWPYFTLYRVDLDASEAAPARFESDHPPGAFEQLIVLGGHAEVVYRGGSAELSPGTPAFVPATLEGGYTLHATEPATVLFVSIPVPTPAKGED